LVRTTKKEKRSVEIRTNPYQRDSYKEEIRRWKGDNDGRAQKIKKKGKSYKDDELAARRKGGGENTFNTQTDGENAGRAARSSLLQGYSITHTGQARSYVPKGHQKGESVGRLGQAGDKGSKNGQTKRSHCEKLKGELG